MSIDSYFTEVNGTWVRVYLPAVHGGEYVPNAKRPDFCTDFWVDIRHGGNKLTEERYYFPDLASAFDFYLGGWKTRQFLDDENNELGLDHSGLYSRGRLIHGRSIHGDAPGREGENLRQICEKLVSSRTEMMQSGNLEFKKEECYGQKSDDFKQLQDDNRNELSAMLRETGEALTEEYWFKFIDVLAELEIQEGPLEIWLGLAHAFSDASGYRVSLQAAMVEPIEGDSNTSRIVGYREVAAVEPNLFTQIAPQ
jgi:hypothetical protein